MVCAAGEIFFTSTMLRLKAKAKRPICLGNAAPSGTIENVGASAPDCASFGSPTARSPPKASVGSAHARAISTFGLNRFGASARTEA